MIPRMKDQHQRILIPSGSVVKNLSANAGDAGSIPGSGRSPGEGNFSYLEAVQSRIFRKGKGICEVREGQFYQ